MRAKGSPCPITFHGQLNENALPHLRRPCMTVVAGVQLGNEARSKHRPDSPAVATQGTAARQQGMWSRSLYSDPKLGVMIRRGQQSGRRFRGEQGSFGYECPSVDRWVPSTKAE